MSGTIRPLRLLVVLPLLLPGPAMADLMDSVVSVQADEGTAVGVGVQYNDGSKFIRAGIANEKTRGGFFTATFTIPDNDKVKIGVACRELNGEVTWPRIHVERVTLVSLEPFDLPVFTAANPSAPLVVDMDITAFLAQGNPFTLGQIVPVTDGRVVATPTLIFKDGSSLPSDFLTAANELLDPATVAALPNYTGEVEVAGLDHYAVVPEPGGLALLVTGALGLIPLLWYGLPCGRPGPDAAVGKVAAGPAP